MKVKGELYKFAVLSKMKEILLRRTMKPGLDQNILCKNF